MRVNRTLLFVIVVLLSGVSGNGFSQGPAPMDRQATSALHPPLLPQARIRAASDQLIGFNLISNTPPVPDVEMHDEAGQLLSFERFQGKLVLFNLWATWCPPCIREMPALNALQAQYKQQGFLVIPVASGRQGEEEPAEFLRKLGLQELTTYYDPDSQFARIFGIDTLPSTFLIDRDGNMRGGALGMLDWGSAEARALIEAFLNEQES
ncbi:MAG: TlpA disulfide reductase family protein [Gammaproteobacteria bacterium]|nr:TlpA disulfide reductase family protein [Gammaproteobacteria bacterium]